MNSAMFSGTKVSIYVVLGLLFELLSFRARGKTLCLLVLSFWPNFKTELAEKPPMLYSRLRVSPSEGSISV